MSEPSGTGEQQAVPTYDTFKTGAPETSPELDPMAATVYGGTVGDSGNAMLEGIIWGDRWNNSQPLTYYFDSAGSSSAWTTAEKDAVRAALQTFTNVANLQFVEVFTEAEANLVERKHNDADQGSLGWHELPNGFNKAVGSFNQNGYGWDAAGLQRGGLGFSTLVHEIGHGLGLAHPHDTGGGSTIFPGVTSALGSFGNFDLNQSVFTIMSYNHGYQAAGGAGASQNFGDAAGPMAFDIAALQFIYGANTTFANGANTYTLPAGNANGTYWSSIWDTGGIDEIVHTGATSSTINLVAATIDNSATGGGSPSFVNGVQGGFTIARNAVIENASGGSAADLVVGNAVANTLNGNNGDDRLFGAGGNDTVNGGDGADTIYGDASSASGSGVGTGTGTITNPTGNTSIATALNITNSFSTASNANIANSTTIPHVTITATTPSSGTVNAPYFAVTLTAGSTIILDVDGSSANFDSEVFIRNASGTILATNDDATSVDTGSTAVRDSSLRYTVASGGTYYIEIDAWSMIDQLPNSATYQLHVSVESPPPMGTDGTAGNDSLSGGNGNDTLFGGAGNDTLVGDAGNDSMTGGAGDDRYIVADAGDVVTEAAGEGTDTVVASINYVLATNFEGLQLVEGSAATTGTAHNGGASILGNSAANTLTGGNGNDTLNGNSGNDALVGGSGNDTLIGGIGNDTLTGGIGTDRMEGGTGDDTFYVADATDIVVENIGEGNDTVFASFNYTLGATFETLTLVEGSAATTGTAHNNGASVNGNSAANTLTGGNGNDALGGANGNDTLIGGSGNDTLTGGVGTDSMTGGTGDDTFHVADAADIVVEAAGGGNDTIFSSANYAMGGNVETMYLIEGTATDGITHSGGAGLVGNSNNNNLTGLAGNDVLLGQGGNDRMDGGAGADNMSGGIGDDTFYIDNEADLTSELAGEGNDTAFSTINFVLGANVETLYLVEGSAATNGITHNGGAGIVGNALNNNLTGGNGNDVLLGQGGNDRIEGGAGADNMAGGLGDDAFYIDNEADLTSEIAGEGNDTAFSTINFVLGANVETLYLVEGSGAINGMAHNGGAGIIGNSNNNNLTGGSGNDVLLGQGGNDRIDGGIGVDNMSGGLGDDTFYVDNVGDLTSELAGEGNDTAFSTINFVLGANVETLYLVEGSAATDGMAHDGGAGIVGNSNNNNLTGGAGIDVILGGNGNDRIEGRASNDNLNGEAGADTLIGGTGADNLTGGTGADFFVFNAIGEAGDTITDFAASDDTLDLRPMWATFTGTGGIANVSSAVTSGHLTFTQAGSHTQVYVDANGGTHNAGEQILIATLNNTTASDVLAHSLIL